MNELKEQLKLLLNSKLDALGVLGELNDEELTPTKKAMVREALIKTSGYREALEDVIKLVETKINNM